MNRSLTLVSGAKKNIGDFLIFNKCREMIQHHLNPDQILELKRTEDFGPHIESINQTDALIICGGPGYRTDFYPGTYPFLKYLDEFTIPILPLGLGWQGEPLFLPKRFRFTPRSEKHIMRIHRKIPTSTTRDEITKSILNRVGIMNVINSGCPTLFDIEKMKDNSPFSKPKEIDTIAVSMAQNPLLHSQNVDLITEISRRFPDVSKLALFHRGTSADAFTHKAEGESLTRLVQQTEALGYEIMDLSYDINRIEIYQEASFHVGYRVHGHAFCVSQRIPSFLLWEDGRGQGMSLNLKIAGVPARRVRLADRLPLLERIRKRAVSAEKRYGFLSSITINSGAIPSIMHLIENQISNDFNMFNSTPRRLAELYCNLRGFFDQTENFLYN
ncbi:MAG: polysaccharide pyruvyl transferase family protein [Candidatus Hodarchaeota archaeon]